MNPSFSIRLLSRADNGALEKVIRDCLVEFDAARPGTAWKDPEMSDLNRFYDRPGHRYLVVDGPDGLVGGAGYAPFTCDRPGTCELQKMYLAPIARGYGLGRRLMQRLELAAVGDGYVNMYLETLEWMTAANRMYADLGYVPLESPLGNSGHGTCNLWRLKTLS